MLDIVQPTESKFELEATLNIVPLTEPKLEPKAELDPIPLSSSLSNKVSLLQPFEPETRIRA